MNYEQFTKRTNEPKLTWIEKQLTRLGIAHRRNGRSFHAPILQVDASKVDAAWEMLNPVDDIPDDDRMFGATQTTPEEEVTCNGCGKTFDVELLNRASLDAFADLSVDYDLFCPCGSDDLTFHKPEEDKERDYE